MMNLLQRHAALLLSVTLTLSLAACGGGGSSIVPRATVSNPTSGANTVKAAAQFKITVPKASKTISNARHAQYISTGTASATIAVTSVNGAPPPAGFAPVTTPLTAGSSNCVSGSALVCSITVGAPPGADAFSVTLSDSNGAALSTNTETVTIVAGQTITAPMLVLGGIAASYHITFASDAATTAHVTLSGNGFQVLGGQPYIASLEPVDASGATIVGPGTPAVAFSSGASAVTVSAVSGQSNTFRLQVVGQSLAAVNLTAHAAGGASTTVPITTVPEYWFSEQPSTGSTEYIRAFSISGTTRAEIVSDTISLPNSAPPWGMAFDTAGNLWAGLTTGPESFVPGSQTPLHILPALNQIAPYYVAFDPSGNLWASAYDQNNSNGVVQELDQTSGTVLNSILANVLLGYGPLAFDPAGRVWVSDPSYETVAGYSTAGALVHSFDFSATSSSATAVAFDPAGHLWVGLTTPPGVGSLKAYDTMTNQVIGSTITNAGLTQPVSISFDAAGNMWVLNMLDSNNDSNVFVYSPSGTLLRTIQIQHGDTDGINYMAVSP